MKKQRFFDKVVVTSGASSGIGKIMRKMRLNKPCRSGFQPRICSRVETTFLQFNFSQGAYDLNRINPTEHVRRAGHTRNP
jgi:hypothetical protein